MIKEETYRTISTDRKLFHENLTCREIDRIVDFFTHNVVYRFGIPRRIISDNGPAFKSTKIYKFASQYKIDWRYSSIYNPRANGLAESFNKTLIKLLKKMIMR